MEIALFFNSAHPVGFVDTPAKSIPTMIFFCISWLPAGFNEVYSYLDEYIFLLRALYGPS